MRRPRDGRLPPARGEALRRQGHAGREARHLRRLDRRPRLGSRRGVDGIEKRGRDKAAVDDIEIASEQNGNVISVEAKRKGTAQRSYGIGVFHQMSLTARLVASIPTGSDLIIRTDDGSIRVEHVSGKVELRSADGSVTGRDLCRATCSPTPRTDHPAGRDRWPVDVASRRRQHRRPGPPRRPAAHHRGWQRRRQGAPGLEDHEGLEPVDRRRLDGALRARGVRRHAGRRGPRRRRQTRLRRWPSTSRPRIASATSCAAASAPAARA